MAIQDDNTILNKGDLKAYHAKILPYLGGNMMVSTNNSDYYSTDEKVVGVWEDGKPIYQKTIHTGPFSIEASSTVAGRGWQRLTAVPANLENLVLARFVNINGTEYKTQQAFAFTMGAIEPGYISVVNFRDVNLAADDALLFLQYTKTTDAAGSGVTTPGAYDINFPNTWPANTEIYFGNGVYGKRYEKTVTGITVNNQDFLFDSSFHSSTHRIYNTGGWIKRSSNGSIINFPASNGSALEVSWWLGDDDSSTTWDGLYLEGHDNGNNTWTCNLWITYTK